MSVKQRILKSIYKKSDIAPSADTQNTGGKGELLFFLFYRVKIICRQNLEEEDNQGRQQDSEEEDVHQHDVSSCLVFFFFFF